MGLRELRSELDEVFGPQGHRYNPLREKAGIEEGFELELPSEDARPGVLVEARKGERQAEALLSVGRHEQLFVWPLSEAEPAAKEVADYLRRIMRISLEAGLGREVERLGDDQRSLAEAVDRLLRDRGARSDLAVRGAPPEVHVEFRLLLPPQRSLDVSINVASDVFAFEANGADLRLHRLDFDDSGEAWADACVSTLSVLLENDLVLRTRRTLLGRRTGAVYVPSESGQGVWNGELLSCKGVGRMHTYRCWWSAL